MPSPVASPTLFGIRSKKRTPARRVSLLKISQDKPDKNAKPFRILAESYQSLVNDTFVTVRRIAMHIAGLHRFVQSRNTMLSSSLGQLLISRAESFANRLELIFDSGQGAAVDERAAFGLASAFGGGRCIGHERKWTKSEKGLEASQSE